MERWIVIAVIFVFFILSWIFDNRKPMTDKQAHDLYVSKKVGK